MKVTAVEHGRYVERKSGESLAPLQLRRVIRCAKSDVMNRPRAHIAADELWLRKNIDATARRGARDFEADSIVRLCASAESHCAKYLRSAFKSRFA